MQPLLFDSGSPGIDWRFRHLRRLELSPGAWIEHQSGWLTGHEQVFSWLRDHVAWRAERRWMYERDVAVPRLIGSLTGEPVPDVLTEATQALSDRYRWDLSRLGACYYRDGADSVAEHGDKVGPLKPDCVIAIVSVGAPRPFVLRPVRGGPARKLLLGWGDLLVMGGSMQQTWLHGVPKVPFAEPRISVQFRPAKLASQDL